MPHPNSEDQILETVMGGLRAAIADMDIKDPWQYSSDIKLQKLTYLAVERFELNVTYSWYLAGAMVANERVSVNIQREEANTSGHVQENQVSLEDVNTNSTFLPGQYLDSDSPSSGPSKHEIKQFYLHKIDDVWQSQEAKRELDTLESIWYTKGREFLETFYQELAPPKYKQLYLSSLRFRNLLSDISEALETNNHNSTQSSLANFGLATTIPDRVDELSNVADNIMFEIESQSEFETCVEPFNAFFELVLDIYKELVGSSLDELPSQIGKLFDQFESFYYQTTWKLAATVIGNRTATGPRANMIAQSHMNDHKSLQEKYPDAWSKLVSRCESLGILTDSKERSAYSLQNPY